jgi:mannose-6-phosphate isomerase-like protein (cupin superfamily)
VEILCDHPALHATWTRFGPGRDGADPHVHRHHSDFFYVLAGELTVMLGAGAEEVVVPAGTLARVPPLVVHGFRNAADRELRYLNFHAPGVGFADYLRAMRDGCSPVYDQEPPPADGGRPMTEAQIGGALEDEHFRLLADVEGLAIAERSGERAYASPEHDQLEALYVLQGELALVVGERELRAPPGSWVNLPPGPAWSCSSAGASPARFLELRARDAGHTRENGSA